MTTKIEDGKITLCAIECAAAALEQGAPRRALTSQEDAGEGDYDALEQALGRRPTRREAHEFRWQYSLALCRPAPSSLNPPERQEP